MRRKILALAPLLFAVVIVLLIWRRSDEPTVEATQSLPTAVQSTNAAMPASVSETNRVKVAPEVIAEINRLITAANPLGVPGPITERDIISRVDYPKGDIVLQTKTHTIALSNNRLTKFVSELESSNPIAMPEAKRAAMRQWYKATGKWTKEEALAETQRILDSLGIRTQWQTREVEATELDLKNPQGETVTLTPFYIVKLDASNAMLRAEFRVGESGPGRLTEWSIWPPHPAGK